MMGQIQEFCVNARPNCKIHVFCWKYNYPSKRVQTHMFSFTNQKPWLEEAEAQVSKIKPKGLDLFLAEYMRMIFKGWPRRKKSHHQANHPQLGHDGTNSRILCQRAPNLRNTCFFCWTYICPCNRPQPHMFSFTNQKKWLEEAEVQVSKIKSNGLDLFWLNTCMIFKGWPRRKKSHHQANHPQIGHDGTNSRILCQRAPKLQNTCFSLKIHSSPQKGTDTYV